MSLTLAVPTNKYDTVVDFNSWDKAVKEISSILDNQEYDKWTIGDLLAAAIPDGVDGTQAKINKMVKALGGRLDKATLGSYRRTALRFPKSKRNYVHSEDHPNPKQAGKPKAFWLYAQCAYREDRFKLMEQVTCEAHLRELIGQRDAYRVKNPRVQMALRSPSVMRDIVTPDLVETWLGEDTVRQMFTDSLITSSGNEPTQKNVDLLSSQVDYLDSCVDRSVGRDENVISLLKYLKQELRFSKYHGAIVEVLDQFEEYDVENISYAKYIY